MRGSRSTYRIGGIAKATGLSVDAIRYYERLGLLPAAPRTTGGARVYGNDAVQKIRFVKQAQALGLTLREIQQMVDYRRASSRSACRRIRDLLAHRIADIDGRMAELRTFRATLCEHLKECEDALDRRPDPHCPTLVALERDA